LKSTSEVRAVRYRDNEMSPDGERTTCRAGGN
jgi:hypothetical protein